MLCLTKGWQLLLAGAPTGAFSEMVSEGSSHSADFCLASARQGSHGLIT